MDNDHSRQITTAKPSTSARPAAGRLKDVSPLNEGEDRDDAEDHIRLQAYYKWEQAGRPNGNGVDFWLDAEQELFATM